LGEGRTREFAPAKAPVRPAQVAPGEREEPDLGEPWPWMVRLRALADRRPTTVDVAAAAGLDVTTAVPLIGHETRPWVWLIDQALIAPLALRRRSPFVIFGVISVVAFIQWLTNVPLAADAALLVALYTVAAHESRQRAIAAAAVLQVGVILASVRFAPAGQNLVTSLVFLTGIVMAALFIGITLRTRRAYLASVVARARQLEHDREREARLAVATERTRIAREMHDIVAHSLAVITALADGAIATSRSDPIAAEKAMATVSTTSRQALQEMRRLLGVLRDDQPYGRSPQPGLEEIDELAAGLELVGPSVEISVVGDARPLSATESSAVYRIVQESLTNVVKHASGATTVWIVLDWSSDALRLQVTDNGSGRPSPYDGTGHGLTGMAERAALFEGTLVAGPSPEGGWSVDAALPIGAR
jgi:signal transduction histidine kinase